jgi:cytosine/adenosine deaminase-related metal-dependent hydrolase
MRYFSAQYVFTNNGPPLKRAVISTLDDGTIVNVEDTRGRLAERHSVEFHNGIIVPGFINCHCHIELSHLRDEIPGGSGLSGFLEGIMAGRGRASGDPYRAMAEADSNMTAEGVVICADICNTGISFELKQKSRIRYISLLEVFGIDPSKASKRFEEISKVQQEASAAGLPHYIVPHSAYSVSAELFMMIKKSAERNRVSSIHFLESEDEKTFLSGQSGPLADAYRKLLAPGSLPDPPADHISAVLGFVTLSGSLILVHNTAIEEHHIHALKKRENLFYCLCPNSNLYIGNKLPPVTLLEKEGCNIVIGTDSLSSNNRLSMVSEMITIQHNFPAISLESLVKWATLNGAMATGEDHHAGTIAPGKTPGLVLIKDTDLVNLKLLPVSSSQRLI